MSQRVWLNGQPCPADDATVSIYDGGFLHGAGLFETMRAYNGVPFRYESHIDRLLASASKLALPIAAENLPSIDQARELITKNGLTDARLRLTVTTGSLRPGADDAPPALSVLLTAVPLSPYPAEFYAKGVTALISEHRQTRHDPLCGHKSTAFFARLLALREAQRRGCLEAVWFTTENHLAEGCISNVFIVKDNVLKTPPTDTPVLPGITRAVVLDLARQADHEVAETALTVDDLLDADEVFVTNSGFELVPVVHIERRPIGREKPGPLTTELLDRYRAEVIADTESSAPTS